MKRYLSLILAIAATVSAQIVPSTGNVRGPTSATDNAVARYDGTTGKLIQNSGVTIDDSGNLTVSGTGTSTFAGNVNVTGTGTNYTAIDTGSFVKFGNNQTSSNLQVGSQGFGGVIQGAQSGSAAYNILAQPYGGNFLVGTTSDTGYRVHVVGANDAQMMLDVASGSQYTSLAFANNGSGKGFVYWDNTNNGLFAGTYAANASLKFNTGLGVLALTLDSSQNATFAGTVKVKNQATLNANGSVAVGTSATTIFSALNTSSANWAFVFGDDGSSGFADLVVTVGNGAAVVVISSATIYGSPPARTYTSNSTNLQLSLASGSLTVRTTSLTPGT